MSAAPAEERSSSSGRKKRVDAVRNTQVLLDAAAAAFIETGIDTPVREIAARAGVGMGTLYRHFPTKADLVVAVYRHQVEACVDVAALLLIEADSPQQALTRWVDTFVEFLVTKHGLANVLHGDPESADALHRFFVEQLVPVGDRLLAAVFGSTPAPIDGYTLLRGLGNLCMNSDGRFDTGRAVEMFVNGILYSSRVR
ncbi:TetR/AcrR family transcriptional regulator [Mycolicibacterium nivoides]|uniref:TetR/AcrR family transcriptional regulator n=1 Tax=Mycolicibacterium nivoides TaxID=2487344 RepID=A0ABW9LK07_9MYCO